MAEFGSGVLGGEVPVDLSLGLVGGFRPGGEFAAEGLEVTDPAVQALARED